MNPFIFVSEWHAAIVPLRDWFEDHADQCGIKADQIADAIVGLNQIILRRDGSSNELPRKVSRREDMSAECTLGLFREDDGDWVVSAAIRNAEGQLEGIATVQFCTPGSGGGGSPHTFRALNFLAVAMAKDNADPGACGRAGTTEP